VTQRTLAVAVFFAVTISALTAEPAQRAAAATAVLLDVPFFCQAPLANWSDPRQQDGCEEASLLMAHLWLTGGTMTAAEAEAEIIAISEWERANYGAFVDRSIADTALLFEQYYGHTNWEIRRTVTVADIKAELAAGNLVIVPTNGRLLANPHFTTPGPITHMVLIIGYDDDVKSNIGYDDETGIFVTNDPGTRNGKSFRYPYERLVNAIYDYPTGKHVPYTKTATVMLVIKSRLKDEHKGPDSDERAADDRFESERLLEDDKGEDHAQDHAGFIDGDHL
jgi:hypothetical protein